MFLVFLKTLSNGFHFLPYFNAQCHYDDTGVLHLIAVKENTNFLVQSLKIESSILQNNASIPTFACDGTWLALVVSGRYYLIPSFFVVVPDKVS